MDPRVRRGPGTSGGPGMWGGLGVGGFSSRNRGETHENRKADLELCFGVRLFVVFWKRVLVAKKKFGLFAGHAAEEVRRTGKT